MYYQEEILEDIVVVGYGLAGATAAISAHDAGDRVIVIEKSARFGGNSILSGGGIVCVDDTEKAFNYLTTLCGGRTDPSVIKAQVNMMSRTGDFLKRVCRTNQARLVKRGRPGMYPCLGREGINSYTVDDIPGFQGYPWIILSKGRGVEGGAKVMKVMEDNMTSRRIPVMFSTSVKAILTDKGHGICGVLADGEGGKITIRARKAVILACGGFEHNESLKTHFLEVQPSYAMSPLTHTGDGVIMTMKLGAALWHMWHIHGSYGFKYPSFPIAFRHHLDGARDPFQHRPFYIKMRWIVVDRKGKRFMNEYPPAPQDTPYRDLARFDPDIPGYPSIPCYLIFDEQARRQGPIARALGLKEIGYQWSEDNSDEIERGWIIRADSLRDLARKINVPPDNLKNTIKAWNKGVVNGDDPDFGRLPETMSAPIEMSPFYAMESWPIITNTQGGPAHNAKQQVLDVSGDPIPRLYAVGELGSMFGHIYELGGNLGECVSSGRTAAESACQENNLIS